MVSAPVIAALFLSVVVLMIAPILILLFLCLRKKIPPKPLLLGFAAFFVSQICLRLPILQALGTAPWWKSFTLRIVPYFLTLAFTAGLFEESARYLCARFFLKGQRSFRDAVTFGLGHGFCEVILLIGVTKLNLLVYSEMLNSGALRAMFAAMPAGTYQRLTAQLLAITPSSVYVSIWERFSAVLFHIFASVLIFRGVNTGKARYYFFALGAHTLFDAASVFLMKYGNVWLCESVICALSLLSMVYVWKVRPHWDAKPAKAAAD